MIIPLMTHREPNELIDKYAERNASHFCNKHVNKILTECCEILLAVAVNTGHADIEEIRKYNETFKEYPEFLRFDTTKAHLSPNHFMVKWALSSKENYNFARWTMEALNDMFFRTRKRPHLSIRKLYFTFILVHPLNSLPNKPLTLIFHPTKETAHKYQHISDPVDAYRAYFKEEKKHLHQWGMYGNTKPEGL